MRDSEPIFWPVSELTRAFATGELSPVEVTEQALTRVATLDPELHSYLSVTPDLARRQAREAEDRYRSDDGTGPPLLGVPLSIKDLFDIRGETTTLGSRAHRKGTADADSAAVMLLRAAGAVFIGKSNTAEFGQSATTDNLLGPECGNPWNPERTSGGSSGGAAASVGAGLASAALGSDGGGSIRIPAAMCGLFGLKPTFARTPQHDTFHAMTEFACSGPITRTVADARLLLAVLLDRDFQASSTAVPRRVAWCPAPQGRPVDPGVRDATARAVGVLAGQGHLIEEVVLPLEGWTDAFGPLVLADEWLYRRHLLDEARDDLTRYVRRGIEAGESVTEQDVADALALKDEISGRVRALFDTFDFVITPTTACVAFPMGARPSTIDGRDIDPLWGPFPFTAPFNVSGSPAASLPVGLVDGMPVGLQVIAAHGREDLLLDLCQQLEEALCFPISDMERRWSMARDDGGL
jgi:Asp-tRNA(Asn)/Glu-tRNA(Gln) amidotransferase A subunit family amidase